MERTDSPLLNPRRIPPDSNGAAARDRPSVRPGRARARPVARILALQTPLPWVGRVGVPLAVTAAILIGSWWALVPLAACAWLCSPGSWAWEWLISLETGLLGALWAALGAYALMMWPDHRPMIGAIWALSAATAATIAFLRRRMGRS